MKGKQSVSVCNGSGRKNRWLVVGALILTGLCYFVFSITGYFYLYSDNLTVAVVTGSMYGNHNFCQYLHPLTCIILKYLNPLIPSADMFSTLVQLFLFIALASLAYLLLEDLFRTPFKDWHLDDFVKCGVFVLAFCFVALGLNIWAANYTVQTAALIFSGMLILFRAEKEGRGRKWYVIGTVLVTFAFMLRVEGALIFIPFFTLEALSVLVTSSDKKNEFRKLFRTLLPTVLLVAGLLISKQIFISQEPYASDTRYTESRTVVQDYPMMIEYPVWMESDRLDVTTYRVVQDWLLVDTDRITVDTLEEAARIGSHNAFPYSMEGLKKALAAMYERVVRMDVHLMVLALVTLLLTLRNIIALKSKWLKLESFLGALGGFIILLYFTFRGRALIRVWQCVLLAICGVLILAAAKDRESRLLHKGNALFMLLLCVVLYFGVGQVIAHAKLHAPATPLTSRINVDDSAYEPTFEGDSLYLWPNWYDAIPEYFQNINKLPTQRVLDHNIPMGDWTYGQQYFREFLAGIHAENPALALLDRPNTYLVEGMETVLLEYMQDHYGEDIALTEVGELMGKKVFKMERTGETGPENEQAEGRDSSVVTEENEN